MEKKLICGSIIIIFIFLVATAVTFKNADNLFMNLHPKAMYKQYGIYDVIEQQGLPCAQAIEILDSDDRYYYYFDCIKSDKIYFVSDKEAIKVREVYNRGIITKEKLYELGIVNRMVKRYAK